MAGYDMCFIWHPMPIRTRNGADDQMRFELYRVLRDGVSMKAELVTLKLIVGPGDQGEPVITILMKDED